MFVINLKSIHFELWNQSEIFITSPLFNRNVFNFFEFVFLFCFSDLSLLSLRRSMCLTYINALFRTFDPFLLFFFSYFSERTCGWHFTNALFRTLWMTTFTLRRFLLYISIRLRHIQRLLYWFDFNWVFPIDQSVRRNEPSIFAGKLRVSLNQHSNHFGGKVRDFLTLKTLFL